MKAKAQRKFATILSGSAFLPVCITLAACSAANSKTGDLYGPGDVGGDAGTSSGAAGSGTAGSSAGGAAGSAGVSGSGAAGAATAGAAGSGAAGFAGNGSAGAGTAGFAGNGSAGAGTAGFGGGSAGAAGSAGVSGSAGSGGTAGAGGGSAGMGGSGTAGMGGAGTAGGSGAAGMGGAGTAGMGGVSGGSGGSPVEDDGVDCTVGTLPATGSLPTVTKLPDPFKKLDGTRMTTKAEWHCRREEILQMAEKYAYGTKPPKPQTVSGTVSGTSITVNVSNGGKNASFNMTVTLPTSGSKPYPAIIVYAGGGFGAPLDPTVINSEGVALINYDPYQVGAEGTPRNNKSGAFYTLYGNTSTSGLLIAWAWGVSRIIDVLEQSGTAMFRPADVGVTGCSRFGKGSFAAGVFDQRIALTMPMESGTGGVPIWRGVNGEGAQTLAAAYSEQPWFGDAFSAFTNAPTKAPIDTHELVAMVAPRGLMIFDNPYIANLGPKSAHVASLGGAEVYKALGVGANISYFSNEASGTHCSMRPEWSAPLRSNIRKYLNHTGNDPGVFNVSPSATGKLSDWIDWTTPGLN